MEVLIKNAQRLLALNRKALLRRLGVIGKAIRCEDDWLSLALTRDGAMRALNARYRGKDEATDVLAFPPPDSPAASAGGEGGRRAFLGEVVISADEVLRQARAEAVDCGILADRLLVHGLLHLKGYDHHTKAKSARMRKEEKRVAGLFDEAWLLPRGARTR